MGYSIFFIISAEGISQNAAAEIYEKNRHLADPGISSKHSRNIRINFGYRVRARFETRDSSGTLLRPALSPTMRSSM